MLAGLSEGDCVAECERVPEGIMAGDQDPGKALERRRGLTEHGFCAVEQVVKPRSVGNVDFQMVRGLSRHDEQLLFQVAPECAYPHH